MERHYVRENGRNFLYLTETIQDLDEDLKREDASMEMIRRNKIPCVLRLQKEWIDNKKHHKYDISGYHSLKGWMEITPVTWELFQKFLRQLVSLLQATDEYLLDESMISFDPEYVFVKLEDETFGFCFLPDGWVKESDNIRELAAFFMDHVDEKDEKLMAQVFRFYRISKEEQLSSDKLKALLKAERQPQEKEEAEEMRELPVVVPEKKKKPNKLLLWLRSLFLPKKMEEEEMWEPSELVEQEEPEEPERAAQKNIQIEHWNNEPTQMLCIDEEESSSPFLLEKDTGRRIDIAKTPFVIGIMSGTDFQPEYRGISRMHLKIDEDETGFFAMDLGSTNGTKHNGRVMEPNEVCRLHHRDTLNLAGALYEFRSVFDEFGMG